MSAYPAIEWIDCKCIHFGRVSLEGSKIILNSIGGAHLFGRVPLLEKNSFSLRLANLGSKIGLGVIDAQYKDQLLFG